MSVEISNMITDIVGMVLIGIVATALILNIKNGIKEDWNKHKKKVSPKHL